MKIIRFGTWIALALMAVFAACSDPEGGEEAHVYVESISLGAETEKTLQVGETFDLKAALTPPNATEKRVIWKSIQPRVALVFPDGLTGTVMGITPGETIIMAITEDGGFMASVTVTVP